MNNPMFHACAVAPQRQARLNVRLDKAQRNVDRLMNAKTALRSRRLIYWANIVEKIESVLYPFY